MKNLCLMLAAGAFAAMFSTTLATAETVELRLHTFVPPVSNPVKSFLQPWADKVGNASGGRLKVTIYPSMQLGGKPPQLTDQVRDGIVDIAWALPGYNPGRYPIVEVFELPFIHTNALATTLAMQDFQKKHLTKEFGDFHVLLLHVHGGNLYMTKAKPVQAFGALKGMKVRAATRTGAWYLESVGAIPVGAPVPKVPEMLSKGIIDATTLPYEIAPAFKLQDLASHFSELEGSQPRINTSVFSFLMNKNRYAKLPADLKKVIDDHSGANIANWAGQNWIDIEVPGKKVMASKSKNQFHTVPAAEVAKFKAAATPVYDKWVAEMKEKGHDGAVLLAEARALVAKYTK